MAATCVPLVRHSPQRHCLSDPVSVIVAAAFALLAVSSLPAVAQMTGQPGAPLSPAMAPITLRSSGSSDLNVAAGFPDPAIIPTDETPTHIGDERQLFTIPLKVMLLERLPARMYFSSVTEVTQRFESNVLSTASQPRRDYVFRVLPNVTLGYNILPRTNVYCNYFVIKDVFGHTPLLNQSTFQSLSGGVQHDIPIGRKTNLQLNFQVRELWQARRFRQADMLPGFTITHYLTPRIIAFFNGQLQMRSQTIFEGPTREMDPFYTLGAVFRKGYWTLTSTGTLVNNFRNNKAIPPQTNMVIICDFELSRPVSRKRLPGLDIFIRAEPIWNWQGKSQPGLSGFDFRFFSGLRLTLSKPSIHPQMETLRKQLRENN